MSAASGEGGAGGPGRDHLTEAVAFLMGAAVGAGIALLLAPTSGAETQRRIREQARKLKEITGERVRDIREDLGTRLESAKGVVDEGRRVASEARQELEEKLERTKAAYRAGIDAARSEPVRELPEGDGGGSDHGAS